MENTLQGRSLQDRVVQHTDPVINRSIMERTEKSLLFYSEYPEQIDSRLARLKKEWDIERTLETNASILGLFGLFMSVIVRRTWFILLPIVVLGFLLQHAVQGWCPPVSVFRRLGIRTTEEIQLELYALRILKGDFDSVPEMNRLDLKDRVEGAMTLLSR